MTDALILILGFTLIQVVEMYFFLMLRVPLELGRELQISTPIANLMLPTWYGLTIRLVKITKWALLILILWFVGWWQVVLCLVIPFVAATWLPVPYTHASNVFERQLALQQAVDSDVPATMLLAALHEWRQKHGF